MRFSPIAIDGAFLIDIDCLDDERGFFARVFCEEEFDRAGLINRFSQSSVSWNSRRGTVRGMHYTVAPAAETKLVRCTTGHIFDVLVDVRKRSPTFGRTLNFELSAQQHNALYIPAGVAHGFQTRVDDCEVLYMIDKVYTASAARGLRWDDPIVHVEWPMEVSTISERDLTFPLFDAQNPE